MKHIIITKIEKVNGKWNPYDFLDEDKENTFLYSSSRTNYPMISKVIELADNFKYYVQGYRELIPLDCVECLYRVEEKEIDIPIETNQSQPDFKEIIFDFVKNPKK